VEGRLVYNFLHKSLFVTRKAMFLWFYSPPEMATGSPMGGYPISFKISWASMMEWSLKIVRDIFSCIMFTAILASGSGSL